MFMTTDNSSPTPNPNYLNQSLSTVAMTDNTPSFKQEEQLLEHNLVIADALTQASEVIKAFHDRKDSGPLKQSSRAAEANRRATEIEDSVRAREQL